MGHCLLVSYVASSACFLPLPAKPATGILSPVSPVKKKMVLPPEIFMAARNGDSGIVDAYLSLAGGAAHDINEQTGFGGTILMGAVSQIDSAAKLAFVWELINRGADLHSTVEPPRNICVFDMAVSGVCGEVSCPELFRDFVLQWLARDPDLVQTEESVRMYLSGHTEGREAPRLGIVFEVFAREQSSRPVAEVVFALVRAGAPLYDRDALERYETRCPALATDEHWLACKDIILGVRAAGSWRAYARLPRKRVLRLRSLMLRGRAKPRRTGAPNVVARTFKLPNEMVWKVLAFWRVESEVTGEVI